MVPLLHQTRKQYKNPQKANRGLGYQIYWALILAGVGGCPKRKITTVKLQTYKHDEKSGQKLSKFWQQKRRGPNIEFE